METIKKDFKIKEKAIVSNNTREQQKVLLSSNSENYNSNRHRILKETGFINSCNYKKELELKKSVDSLNILLEEEQFIDDLSKVLKPTNSFKSKEWESHIVLEYSKLLEFCKENDLLFGKASAFTKELPIKIIKELEELNLSRFGNLKGIYKTGETVLKDNTDEMYINYPDIYIASSPEDFESTNGFISNREVILSKVHKPLSNLGKSKVTESFIMVPMKYQLKGKKEYKIYLTIIKIW